MLKGVPEGHEQIVLIMQPIEWEKIDEIVVGYNLVLYSPFHTFL